MTDEQRQHFLEMLQREEAALQSFDTLMSELLAKAKATDDDAKLDALLEESYDVKRRFDTELEYAQYLQAYIKGESDGNETD